MSSSPGLNVVNTNNVVANLMENFQNNTAEPVMKNLMQGGSAGQQGSVPSWLAGGAESKESLRSERNESLKSLGSSAVTMLVLAAVAAIVWYLIIPKGRQFYNFIWSWWNGNETISNDVDFGPVEGMTWDNMPPEQMHEYEKHFIDTNGQDHLHGLGGARYQSDRKHIKYYGKTSNERNCAKRCSMSDGCDTYVWHHPDYPNRNWRQSCYGTDQRNITTHIMDPHLSSGMKPVGREGTMMIMKPTINRPVMKGRTSYNFASAGY